MTSIRFALLVGLLIAAACSAGGPAAGPITIETVTGATAADAFVRVSGLSREELRALSAARLQGPAWDALFVLGVEGADAPMAGRIIVTDTALEFRPAFPFDPGRAYIARVDPSRLPTPRPNTAVVVARIGLHATPRTPSTTVTGLSPSASVWPENMLRFYVYFSAPMTRGRGTTYLHLMDANGHEVPDAILAAFSDLWNPDGTRLTVFFDPGRVKRGVGPNVTMGRALVAGEQYAIVVDREWPDANGQPLVAQFERRFTAGPAAYRALSTSSWRVSAPKAGTTQPVDVTFPAPLDRALLERAIGIEDATGRRVDGTTAIAPADTHWQFTPTTAWAAGAYRLVVLTLLEDLAGNRIGRAFEVLSESPAPADEQSEAVRVAFDVR